MGWGREGVEEGKEFYLHKPKFVLVISSPLLSLYKATQSDTKHIFHLLGKSNYNKSEDTFNNIVKCTSSC